MVIVGPLRFQHEKIIRTFFLRPLVDGGKNGFIYNKNSSYSCYIMHVTLINLDFKTIAHYHAKLGLPDKVVLRDVYSKDIYLKNNQNAQYMWLTFFKIERVFLF